MKVFLFVVVLFFIFGGFIFVSEKSDKKYPILIRQYNTSYRTSKIDSIRGNTIYFIDKGGYNVSIYGNYTILKK